MCDEKGEEAAGLEKGELALAVCIHSVWALFWLCKTSQQIVARSRKKRVDKADGFHMVCADVSRAMGGKQAAACLIRRKADEIHAVCESRLNIIQVVANIDDAFACTVSRASSRARISRLCPPPSAPCANGAT